MSGYRSASFWMDLNIEVAPFLMIPSQFRDKPVFVAGPAAGSHWDTVVASFPFPATQNVLVDAALAAQGGLTAKVHYSMRGDNELVLRLAFHHSPRDKWKELAQLLSLTDGFRGQVERQRVGPLRHQRDRKSTRLNSSHGYISYAVFCLQK